MKYRFLTIIIGLFISSLTYGQGPKYSKVKIYLEGKSKDEIAKLAIPFEEGELKKGVYFIGILSQFDVDKLKKYQFQYDILIDDMTGFYQKRNRVVENLDGGFYTSPPHLRNTITDEKTIYYNIPESEQKLVFVVINAIGEVVYKQSISASDKYVKISTKTFNNGVYFYQIKNDKKIFVTKKLVVSR